MLQHTAIHLNSLQLTGDDIEHVAGHQMYRFRVISNHTATHCNTLQHTAIHCNTLQHTATHYNTQVITTEAVAAGHELYESYQISSIKDNSFLAYMFGFTLANNRKQVQQLGSTVRFLPKPQTLNPKLSPLSPQPLPYQQPDKN